MPAIPTLTLNPALDLFTSTARVEPMHKLRCGPALVHPGGGGINVARVLARLGADVRVLYPAGGVTGSLLHRLLRDEGVADEVLPIAGETRQSFSAHDESTGLDYRFVLPGPTLSDTEWQRCLDRSIAAAAASGWLVASGSLPPGVPDDAYARLARRCRERGIRLVLDTSGPPLALALGAGVHLAKPSLRELAQATHAPLATLAQQQAACAALVRSGQAQLVALSLGADGALLVTREGAWRAPALAVDVVSTIGAGDSFVGGLVFALARGEDAPAAFRHGMAASAAALLSSGTALCSADDVQRLMPQVRIEPLP